MKSVKWLLMSWAIFSLVVAKGARAETPAEFKRWFAEQTWERDTDGPIISLGERGDFDDSHIFAPAVAKTGRGFQLWYCGSRGTVGQRVFKLGLATSKDGRAFEKHSSNPVFTFGNKKDSILTPTVLRNPNGTTLRENDSLRIWFSSTWFAGPSGLHALHESSSSDGVIWSTPSEPLLKNVYAPTVIKTGQVYQMWYTDVGADPWIMRHASSSDGRKWRVTAEPVVVVDQDWERGRLFYPTVLKIDDVYLMWYGSYWSKRPAATALGFAVSLDGLRWYKHPGNPVLRPDPNREWESNYVTSQSVMQLPDGSFRIWYASRKKPPFVNKYFALNTASWSGPKPKRR